MTMFRADAVDVRYGGVHALKGVSLDIAAGQLVGLIGPNGAGKTTFIDAVTGFTPAGGRVVLDGADLSAQPAHRRARRGLARTWQSGELFDDLTVAENLAVSAQHPSWLAALGQTAGRRPRPDDVVAECLDRLDLGGLADSPAHAISQGQRKLVGVARALAARPRLICLDEPAAGLDTTESAKLGRHLRAVADRGTALLLVDHDMGLVLGICDHVVVLEFGAVIAAGPPAHVRQDPAVLSAYLGADDQSRRAAGR
ncbi:ABC transporter ATP-binding protein [Actinoplanes subtropicus]|uniref:ABC transporter ATP-binding protein n=1 Tax=Actinoplanes subtropicus TaxID=543632 RepID=UPI00054FEBEF|nr:ABC transporter ATP-binding protein [Actinoplanes subtropicus]